MARLPQSQDRTYRRHFRGWLSRPFTSEVFAVVSLTLFLSIMLEQCTRDNGFLTLEHTVRCINNNAIVPCHERFLCPSSFFCSVTTESSQWSRGTSRIASNTT
ncbi:hypothetical protein AURDEDRAFT_72421 [Auricularia subglabra TFB-10046 SS5]|nr:hypothetical protein AURDEDRAFT_72421 [Auricularia subglabra TFB-10046 SS5]